MLLTNRWILEPTLEGNLYGRNDAKREQGARRSRSDRLVAGIRLRF
ncbi:copper resistance protein B [Pseudomonas sp. 10-1B]